MRFDTFGTAQNKKLFLKIVESLFTIKQIADVKGIKNRERKNKKSPIYFKTISF